jgi:hypothetical protein
MCIITINSVVRATRQIVKSLLGELPQDQIVLPTNDSNQLS